MASIIVRGLDESVKSALAKRARDRGLSMEAEMREILTQAVRRPNLGLALLEVAREVGGTEELSIPSRTDMARVVDFE